MDLRIGSRIMEMRKKKGMTQEQLAMALGVSAPAVSKWETDSSYPDIALLCPLARALGTDVDSLLAFEEDLSQERLGEYVTGIMGMVREGRIREAEAGLNRLLHSYPSNIPLKFHATAVLTLFEMNAPESSEEDKARWTRMKKDLIQAVHDDGNPAFYMGSISMLVSLALADGDLEQAESLLKETLTNTADFTMLWVRLYIQKGEKDKALATVQRRLYVLVGEVKTCLTCMLAKDITSDTDARFGICDVIRKMDEIFCVGAGLDAGLFAEVCQDAGLKEECMTYLERLVDNLWEPMPAPNPLLFSPAMDMPPQGHRMSREMQMTILHGMEKDACFEEIRGEERFQRLIRRLKCGLNADAGTSAPE